MRPTPTTTATPAEKREILCVIHGALRLIALEPAPMKAVYAAMARTVPLRKVPRKAHAASLFMASAGSIIRSASGCSPWMTPVAKVPMETLLSGDEALSPAYGVAAAPTALSSAGLPISRASQAPRMPMVISVTPTIACPHCEITSIPKGSRSLRRRKSAPNASCPVLCPQPQSPPNSDAWRRLRPMVRGARAARWSGPVRV
mmetsp:Transcript_7167/g.24790  ORF Transcript_7167/g.24790 Transcript_7167/m.24790 type:complete len:202 (+) Transcript_7167:304-909(+)